MNLNEWYGAKRQSRLRAERRRRIAVVIMLLAIGLVTSAGLGAILRLLFGVVLP